MAELLRSRENILSDLVRSILANTDLDDISPNSSLSILLDAISGVMFQNQMLVLKILESTSLETITGIDLDRKAISLGLPDTVGGVGRRPASPSSGQVKISSAFKKLSSRLYAGKPAPFVGTSTVYVENASSWPSAGSLYIGRGTANSEEGPIPYTIGPLADKGTFWEITLGGVLTKNHSLSESVISAQGGDRTVPAGTVVSTTASANSPAIQFTTDFDLLIQDGEDSGTVTVTAITFGSQSNALSGAINSFLTSPFNGSAVSNPSSFANGRSTESDEDLRQRIRDYPATLARGTKNAIQAAILGLRDPKTGKAISSVIVIEPSAPEQPSKVYINDGSLLEPSFDGQSYEQLLASASGQEIFFRTAKAPITPCVAVGAKTAPFSLVNGETLIVTIDGTSETYTVREQNYANLASVSVFEIIRDFNDQANICAFRTVDGGASIAVFDLSGSAEIMTISAGTLQNKLGLSTAQIRPIYVYKNSKLLSFKGKTATLTTAQYPWGLTSADLLNVQVVVDSIVQTFTITNVDFSPFFRTIATASLDNWAAVLSQKISGVKFTVVGNTIVWSSYQDNSPNSSLEILTLKVKPAAFIISSGLCTVITPEPHGLTGSPSITIKGSSLNSLNGDYVASVTSANTFTFSTALSGSGTFFYSDPSSVTAGWIGNGKMWTAPTLLNPLSDVGAAKDFSINRFVGEIKLDAKPAVGENIEVATKYTRAQIASTKASAGSFSVAPAPSTTGSSRMIVSFDGEYLLRNVYFQAGSTITITPDVTNSAISISPFSGLSPDTEMFQDVNVGDYVYFVPDASLSPALNSAISKLYKVKSKAADSTHIKFDVATSEIASFGTGSFPVIEGSILSFYSTTTPQIIDFSTASTISVDTAAAVIAAQIKSGSVEKISSSQIIIRSNALEGGSAAVLGVVGNAGNMFAVAVSENLQPHVASLKTDEIDGAFPVFTIAPKSSQENAFPSRGFLAVDKNLTNITGLGADPAAESSSLITAYPVGYQEAWLTGKLSGHVARTYNTTQVAPFTGFMRTGGIIANIGQVDTLSDLNTYRNLSLRLKDLPFTPSDRLVVEMDLDDTQKTISVPMAKRATIASIDAIAGNGLGQILSFKLSDPDDLYDHDSNVGTPSIPRPFFENYSPFRTFNLKDFKMVTKSIAVYPVSGGDRGLAVRSTTFAGNQRVRVSLRYPLAANLSNIVVTHKNTFKDDIVETHLLVTIPSDTLSQAITSGTLNIQTAQSGSLAELTFLNAAIDPTKFAPGRVLRFGGNHPLSGAYLITASASGQATVLAPSYLNYSTVPVPGLTLQTQASSNIIRVAHSSHGYTTNDIINVTAAGSANGISSGSLSASSAPITVIDSNSYEYTALASANPAPTGSLTARFPYSARTLTTTAGSTTVVVDHVGHNLFTGDLADIANAPSLGLGGISQSDLQVTNASVTYVNANQYSYSAFAAAPASTASVQLTKATNVTFDTNNGSNIISVNHSSHNYVTGALITFSGAAGVAGLLSGQLNVSAIITVIDSNTYSYPVSGPANANTTGNSVTSTYGIATGTLTTTPGSTSISVSLVGHSLASGAVLDITALAGAGGLTSPQLSVTGGSVTVLNASQFTYTVSTAVPTNVGTADVRRSDAVISVSVPNGYSIPAGQVNATHTNHRLISGQTMQFIASSAIGGISAVDLSVSVVVGSSQLTVGNVNTYSFIAAAAAPVLSTTGSVIRPVVLSLTQYPLYAYPIDTPAVRKTVQQYADAINAYLPRNPIARGEALGANVTTNYITEATYITYPAPSFFSNTLDMEVAYDYHSFAGKLAGNASIFQYPIPADYITLAAYNAAIVPNAVKALVQTPENLFATTTEIGTAAYTPVGEEVYLIPSNARTLKDWLSFPAISSLYSQANVDVSDSFTKVQISSKLDGFSGAVKITGVTANAATMFAKGVGTTVYDLFQLADGGRGASRINVDYASALPFERGMLVKVENQALTELLRPYRTIPTGTSITSANTTDIVPFFRNTTEIKFVKTAANQARLVFKRFGTGQSQLEPLNLSSGNLVDPITVNFSNTKPDSSPLPSGVVRVTVSDPTNAAILSARVGDMMLIRGSTIKTVTNAIWQSGNTVRYTFGAGSGPDGIEVNQFLTVAGFVTYTENNGSYQVLAVTNTYIELLNTNRVDGTKDETISGTVSFGLSVPTYLSPFAADQQCNPIISPLTSTAEYLGYPVIHVYDSKSVLIIAPNITTFGNVSIPNTNTTPVYKSSLVFLPAISNEKNVRTNRQAGSKYAVAINSGNMDVLVKKLGGGFMSVWASNSSAETTDSLLLDQCQVNTDDYAIFGTDFALPNQGVFKIAAHNGRNHLIVHNPTAVDEIFNAGEFSGIEGTDKWMVGPFTNPRPIRILDAESVRLGDSLRISSPKTISSWFSSPMIGSFTIIGMGYHSASDLLDPAGTFNPELVTPYVDIAISDAPATVTTVSLGGNTDAVGFIGASAAYGYRTIAGYAIDPQQPDLANVYLQPDLPSVRMSESNGTKATALYKLGFSDAVVRGIDGYRVFSGLIQEAHKVIDGVATNSVAFPGVKAAGTSVEVLTPLLKSVTISLIVQTKDGVDKITVSEIVKSTVAGYVNALGVGKPVILSEVIKIVQSLAGVFSVQVVSTSPAATDSRIAVADIEKAAVLDSNTDIVVS